MESKMLTRYLTPLLMVQSSPSEYKACQKFWLSGRAITNEAPYSNNEQLTVKTAVKFHEEEEYRHCIIIIMSRYCIC